MSCISISLLADLADQYPFTEKELEQLVRCYEHHFCKVNAASSPLQNSWKSDAQPSFSNCSCDLLKIEDQNNGSIILKLASSSHPLFSTEDVMHRARLTEEGILPWSFIRTLEKALLESFYVTPYGLDGVDEGLLNFLEEMAICMGRRGPRQAIDFLFDSATPDSQEGCGAPAIELVRLCYLLAAASSILAYPSTHIASDKVKQWENLSDPPKQLVASLVQLAKRSELSPSTGRIFEFQDVVEESDARTIISRPQFREWVDCAVPLLASTLPTFLHDLLFLGTPFPKSRSPFRLPDMGNQRSVFFGDDPYSPLRFCFSSLSPCFCSKVRK